MCISEILSRIMNEVKERIQDKYEVQPDEIILREFEDVSEGYVLTLQAKFVGKDDTYIVTVILDRLFNIDDVEVVYPVIA